MRYLPIVDLRSRRVVGLQTLSEDSLEPTLDRVAADLGRWRSLALYVAISVSPDDHPQWAQRLLYRLERAGVEGPQVGVEVTASQCAHPAIGQLAQAGLRVRVSAVLDAALRTVMASPATGLCLDAADVVGLPADKSAQKLCLAVLRTAQAWGLDCLAQGVSTEGQYAYLLRQHCQLGRGPFFSPPVRSEEVPDLVRFGRPDQRVVAL